MDTCGYNLYGYRIFLLFLKVSFMSGIMPFFYTKNISSSYSKRKLKIRGAWGREMRQMDCLHECYSFTFYASVTLEELMPCKFANQIASVISKHSTWFIRIINTVQRKFMWIQYIILWSTKEICAAPYL